MQVSSLLDRKKISLQYFFQQYQYIRITEKFTRITTDACLFYKWINSNSVFKISNLEIQALTFLLLVISCLYCAVSFQIYFLMITIVTVMYDLCWSGDLLLALPAWLFLVLGPAGPMTTFSSVSDLH